MDGLFFYPCSGRAVENDFNRFPNIVNVELTPVRNPPTAASGAVVGKPRTAVHLSEKKLKENCAKVGMLVCMYARMTGGHSCGVVGCTQTPNTQTPNPKQASAEFRDKVGRELLPRLRAFRPDLLFVSAGFDGHALDLYHYYTDEDFAWLTRELVDIAEANRAGVVSVLEG